MLRTLRKMSAALGKRVLVRVDFNVPMNKGRVVDATRIAETLPTLRFLLQKKAKIILITHLGRPGGKIVPELRLEAIGRELTKMLKKKVPTLRESIGPSVRDYVGKMKPGELVLLENIRFHPEEEKNDRGFSKKLAALGDFFVNDAFATCHRAHASTAGVAKLLPSYAGFLLEREVKMLTPLLKKAKKPLTLIAGGAKVDTKIGLLKNFFGKADHILIGGALANTFLAAQGYDIGSSLFESEKIAVAREILMSAEKKGQEIFLPNDVVVADEIGPHAQTANLPIEDIEGKMKILDIGLRTQERYAAILKKSKTIIWNGPMGLYEFAPFAGGTGKIAKTLAALHTKSRTYIGGGDTIDALKRSKVSEKKIAFISTGGGAMLEFLEGKKLPGVEVLFGK